MESTISRQSTQLESQMDQLSINEDQEEVKEAPIIVEDKHEKLMRELKETRARAAATIERSAVLKVQIQDTIEKSMEVDRKFEQFKADFGNVMNQMARNIADKLGGNPLQGLKFTHKPEVVTVAQAAQHLIGKKRIMILTGAGLSAASGIPTFRGAKGFWTQKGLYAGYSEPEEILKMETFKKDPQVVWHWHYEFLELMRPAKPNQGHKAVHNFQKLAMVNPDKFQCMLVTQNIDNFHCEMVDPSCNFNNFTNKDIEGTPSYAFTEGVYEIHGNVLYMRCGNFSDKECSEAPNFFKCPDLKPGFEMPKCKKCGAIMKPHCMFFDESYSEQWYRSDSVRKFLDTEMDALIVVGTALQTALARAIVNSALQKMEVPIIEVNLEPCIAQGYGLLVTEGSETALPALYEEFHKNLLGVTTQKNSTGGVPKNTNNAPTKPSGPSKSVINSKKTSKK